MQPKGLIVAVPLALAAALSLFIVSSDTASNLRIVVGVAFLLVAFVSTRLSLYLLVFSMLLSPEFLVGGLTGGGGASGRGITLRFDDFLLVVIGFVWIAKMAILKGGTPFLRTALNGPIMFYIAAAGLEEGTLTDLAVKLAFTVARITTEFVAKRLHLSMPLVQAVLDQTCRDGMLEGANVEAMAELARAVPVPVIASGGVTTLDDIRRLARQGLAGCIVGRALYTGDVRLGEALDALAEQEAAGAR